MFFFIYFILPFSICPLGIFPPQTKKKTKNENKKRIATICSPRSTKPDTNRSVLRVRIFVWCMLTSPPSRRHLIMPTPPNRGHVLMSVPSLEQHVCLRWTALKPIHVPPKGTPSVATIERSPAIKFVPAKVNKKPLYLIFCFFSVLSLSIPVL